MAGGLVQTAAFAAVAIDGSVPGAPAVPGAPRAPSPPVPAVTFTLKNVASEFTTIAAMLDAPAGVFADVRSISDMVIFDVAPVIVNAEPEGGATTACTVGV